MKESNFDEKDINIFKDILIEYKNSFETWKTINQEFNRRARTNHRNDWNGTRHYMAKIINESPEHQSFRDEHGIVISKNSVGAKLSKDGEEINAWLKGEHSRAMCILRKIQPGKIFYVSLQSVDNFDLFETKCKILLPNGIKVDISNTGLTQEQLKENGAFFKEQVVSINSQYRNVDNINLATEILKEAAYRTIEHIEGKK